jgi:hypothetical protein
MSNDFRIVGINNKIKNKEDFDCVFPKHRVHVDVISVSFAREIHV